MHASVADAYVTLPKLYSTQIVLGIVRRTILMANFEAAYNWYGFVLSSGWADGDAVAFPMLSTRLCSWGSMDACILWQ